MLKTILLQKETVMVYVDDELYEKIPRKGWWINSYGYAVHQKKAGGKRINTYLHHLVLPAKKGFDVDHINRNKLDNRKENLRLSNRSQNGINRGSQVNSKSGIKGVCKENRFGYWRAYLSLMGKQVFSSYFKHKKDAIIARKNAEKKYHGGTL